jgi:tetratricopeptide (TPR) repeat protein
LQVFKRDNSPEKWAEIQINLGKAYDERIYGNRIENQEQAIDYYLAGLSLHTREDFPEKWAGVQHNLGEIYGDRIKGDRVENSELAISAYQLASSVYTREDFPEKWATVQLDLGVAYYRRMLFDSREQNLEIAIDCYHKALSVLKHDAFPIKWAGIQFNLGAAYSARKSGDQAKNLADAITATQAALQIYTREDFPKDWANIQNNLGQAYSSWSQGDRNENIKLAIQYYHAGLEVCTRETFPEDWCRIQMNLGNVYRELGEIAEAITCFRSALEVVTPTSFPINCVVTGYYLGETAFAHKLWAEAIEGYGIALEAMETNRSWASTDTRRQEIQQQAFSTYTNIVQAYINTNQIDKAIEYVERNKARNLVELLVNRNLYPKGNIPETVVNELDHRRREIDAEQRRLEIQETIRNSNGVIVSREPPQPTNILQVTFPDRTYLNQLRQQLDELIAREISPIDPNFRLTQKVEPIPFSQIQALTGENTAILEWYITEDKFLTFIITPQSPTPLLWQSSKEDFKALVNWADEYLRAYLIDRLQWQQNLTSRLQHLAEILHLDELLSHIPPSCDQLGLIPHRFLHLYPLHALPVSRKLATDGVTDKLTASLPSNSSATSALNISCQSPRFIPRWSQIRSQLPTAATGTS